MSAEAEIDAIIPKDKVLKVVSDFLRECDWRLEIDDRLVRISKDVKLYVWSRAFIKADALDVFLGDHYEAVVLLGYERDGDNLIPKYGILKMYFNKAGQFVSEDRYSKFD